APVRHGEAGIDLAGRPEFFRRVVELEALEEKHSANEVRLSLGRARRWKFDPAELSLARGEPPRSKKDQQRSERSPPHHGRSRASARNRGSGLIFRQRAAKSERNPELVTSLSESRVEVMKSLRLRSSMKGWFASKPRGGRRRVSPWSSSPARAFFHRPGRATMDSRTLARAGASGCQRPAAVKQRRGSRCR